MKVNNVTILRNLFTIRSTLSQYHPLLIEGHTKDSRDPSQVASRIVSSLQSHFDERNITKPIILISQGDPLTEKGISAITRHVAETLNIKRCLICLDQDIDENHMKLADRHDVIYELKYSQLLHILREHEHNIVDRLTKAVHNKITYKNNKRAEIGKDSLADWYRTYALLQEVSKSALKIISGGVTVAHTIAEIEEFSVTSFYEVGLDLDLIQEIDIVSYFQPTEDQALT